MRLTVFAFRFFTSLSFVFFNTACFAQLQWKNVDSLYQPLPASVHVFYSDSDVDGKPFKAFYLIADLKDRQLDFTTDTTFQRRLTPTEFYEKNNQPLAVVNTTFFSFETNQNLNMVVKDGKMVSQNNTTTAMKGKDTLKYAHSFASAIGINKKREADVVWTYTDSAKEKPYAMQVPRQAIIDSSRSFDFDKARLQTLRILIHGEGAKSSLKKWKVKTAVGGGPVLVQNGEIAISNNEERKFGGKAINDKHPRTAMGYTKNDQLIILVVEGRNPAASGASLTQEAQILKDLGCVEALNLDGGGSSCLLINGKETIAPSDKKQRAVPAVFIIQNNN